MIGDVNEIAKQIVGGDEPETAAPEEADGKQAAAQEMMSAFKSGDTKALLGAFKALFDILESEPHEEAGE